MLAAASLAGRHGRRKHRPSINNPCRPGGNPKSRWARGSRWACLWVAREAVKATLLNAPRREAGRQRAQEVEEPLGDGLQVNRHEVAVQHPGDNSLALGDYFGHFRFGHSSMITLGCVRRHPGSADPRFSPGPARLALPAPGE